MFNRLMIIRDSVNCVPRGKQAQAAVYAYAYGASFKTIYLKTGVSKRRLKKLLGE